MPGLHLQTGNLSSLQTGANNNSTIEERIASLEQFKMITELNIPNLDERIRNLKSMVKTTILV